jgi:hypothetical protein
MPTQTDYPIGVGATDNWGLWGGASKMVAVTSDDGDSTFILADSGGFLYTQLFTFPLLVGVGDPVTSATLNAKMRAVRNGGGAQSLYFVWNSVRTGANQWSSVGVRPDYASVSITVAAPALSAVNGQHGCELEAAGGPSNKCEVWTTLFYRTVTYTYLTSGGGEFAYLVGSLLGACIGANLLLSEMPALNAALWEKRHVRLLQEEIEPAWRAWTAQKHMRMVG